MKGLAIIDGMLDRLCRGMDLCLKWFAFALMFGLSCSALVEVLIRYFLPVPPRWAGGEVPSVLLMWVTAVGIVLAVRRVAHLRLDIMSELLPPRSAAALQAMVDLAAMTFMLIFAWLTYQLAVDNINTQMPGLGISYAWVNAALVFGASFSVFFFVKQITGGLVLIWEASAGSKAERIE